MAGIGRIFSRIFFWAYERGTVPYDIAVAANPRVRSPHTLEVGSTTVRRLARRHRKPRIELISDDQAAGTLTYHVDARLLGLANPGN